ARALEAVRIAALALPSDGLVAEIETGHIDVGCFLIVLKMVAAAATGDAAGRVHSQTPAGEVQRVDAVVAEFARAPMPEPVPVVVQNVVVEGTFRSWTLPKRVVQPLGDGGRLAVANRATTIRVPRAGEEDLADLAFVKRLD